MTRRAAAIWALAPAFAAALVFSGALSLDFALDDIPLVRDNPSIRDPARLLALFGEPYWVTPGESYGLYRPLTVASLALNRALTGEGPRGFHAGNVAVHALVSALAWFLARRLGVHYGTALAASLLFAVHPLRVEAVANVAGRAELLAAAGVFGAWLAHRLAVEARGPSRRRWFAAAAFLWLAAVLSKESAVLAPLVFAVDDRLRRREPNGSPSAPTGAWVGYGVAAAVALALRAGALGGLGGPASTVYLDNPAAFEGPWARVATALWVHARYLALLAWPATLSSDYSYDAVPVVASFTDPRLFAGLAAAAATAGGFALAWRRGWRTVAVAIACWVLLLLPGSNLLFASGTLMGERLTYLPAFGAFLLAGHGLARLGRARPAAAAALAGALVVACGVRSAIRVPAWKDNLTLATTDVRSYPRSAKLQAGAGLFLAGAGRDGEAEAHLREAVSIWPDYAQARYNLAVVLIRRRAYAPALDELVAAHRLAPANPGPLRLVASLVRAGGTDPAVAAALSALGNRPDLPQEVRTILAGPSGPGQPRSER
jgi:tetratricopeptide (TPR) repeat protein